MKRALPFSIVLLLTLFALPGQAQEQQQPPKPDAPVTGGVTGQATFGDSLEACKPSVETKVAISSDTKRTLSNVEVKASALWATAGAEDTRSYFTHRQGVQIGAQVPFKVA